MASDLPCCVGMQCQALWADDGKHYPAEVLSVFTKDRVELCRVKFLQYDDEVEVRAADLKPLAKPQRPQKQGSSASSSPVPHQQAAAASVFPAASPATAPPCPCRCQHLLERSSDQLELPVPIDVEPLRHSLLIAERAGGGPATSAAAAAVGASERVETAGAGSSTANILAM